jgi:hypothetical protein
MNRVKHIGIITGVIVLLFLIFSQTAYASVDTGTHIPPTYSFYIGVGTIRMLLQVLAGVGVGALVLVFGVYRIRVKMFFSNLFNGRRHANAHEESEESEES